MGSTLARKLFSRRVTIPANQAISFYGLMQLAPATTGNPVWGQNADGSPSMDSSFGDGATIIPASFNLYVGNSSGVSSANSASTYIGVPVTAAQAFVLNDYWPGPVDTEQIWLFSTAPQEVDLVFQGRG